MDLRPILAAHRERAERDKDAIMTLVRGRGRQHSSQRATQCYMAVYAYAGGPYVYCPAGFTVAFASPASTQVYCIHTCVLPHRVCTAAEQVMKSVQTPYQRLRLGDTNLLVALDKNTQVGSGGGGLHLGCGARRGGRKAREGFHKEV
jgi:hypothetical protein